MCSPLCLLCPLAAFSCFSCFSSACLLLLLFVLLFLAYFLCCCCCALVLLCCAVVLATCMLSYVPELRRDQTKKRGSLLVQVYCAFCVGFKDNQLSSQTVRCIST